jgi:L,D-transpeptidase YcbB
MRLSRVPHCLCLIIFLIAGWAPPAFAASPKPEVIASHEDKVQTVATEIRAQTKGRLKKFYAARSFVPLWASTGTIGPEADTLIEFLATADLDGLKASSYKVDDLRQTVAEARSGEPRLVARAEIKLSNSFARYVSDLRKPSKFMKAYLKAELKPKKLKADTILGMAALPRSFAEYVSAMGWMSPHYVRLRNVLSREQTRGSTEDTKRRLRLNLERARALPGPWTHHIVVDSASGKLWYYQAGKQLGAMRVVVGKPQSPTPMIAGMLQYAILNPYWNVPTDLAQHSIAPKILSGRSLSGMGFEALSDWSAAARLLDPATINWSAVASGAQEIRLRQLPGASNAMGRVKFMFPNDLGIYLHDTPERDLLAKENRHLSNGCIRLEDANALGKWLLGRSIQSSSKVPEQVVPLPLHMPLYLTYFSAIEKDGSVSFLEDVYGRDQ